MVRRTNKSVGCTARKGGRGTAIGAVRLPAMQPQARFQNPARPKTRHGTRVRMDSSTVSFVHRLADFRG